ncbi:glycosyltransferase family 2 protein [Nonomuraea sp. NPDC046570]|uniref:glycosyltransferase family 2 protein n=1 Tax=Nonomuraea sp. NPDC046570 TaxID=3155255 RepID=UPI0033D46A25
MSGLSVVVLCLNEADNVVPAYREIVAELGGHDLEVLFVDDGSTDATLALIRDLAAEDPRVAYISFTRNFGIEAAFAAGYRYARKEWILHLDADLQFPPAEGRRLLHEAELGGFDAVFGVRAERRDPPLRRLATTAYQFVARRLLGIELPPGGTTFRLVRAALARRIVDLRLGTPYFLATLPRLTSAWTTVPVEHRARARGRSKVSVRGLAVHVAGLFFGFSHRPMAFAVAGCLVGALLCLVPGVDVRYPLALGLVALAVVGRYVIQVARDQPRPPPYVIRVANLPVDAEELLCGN